LGPRGTPAPGREAPVAENGSHEPSSESDLIQPPR